jgi:hypothetical protein
MAPKLKTNETVNFRDQKGIKICYSKVQTDARRKRYAHQFTQQRQGKKQRLIGTSTHTRPSKHKTGFACFLTTLPNARYRASTKQIKTKNKNKKKTKADSRNQC